MTTVPNWITKAVIVEPVRDREARIVPTLLWRATKTQVVVTADGPHGPVERRFYLDTLTEVGEPKSFRDQRTRLASPDDPAVITAKRAAAVSNAQWMVLAEIERQRLRDYTGADAAMMLRKLEAVHAATARAMASLTDAL